MQHWTDVGCAPAGTYFWHDHSSANRADGLQGPLIVLPPEGTTPPGTPHYDSEETVFIQDWFHAQGPVLAFHLQRCLAMSSSLTERLLLRQRMVNCCPCIESWYERVCYRCADHLTRRWRPTRPGPGSGLVRSTHCCC